MIGARLEVLSDVLTKTHVKVQNIKAILCSMKLIFIKLVLGT